MVKARKHWMDELVDSIDRQIDLETTDGVRRTGKITGFEFRCLEANGTKIDIPLDIELNGDPNDRVPIDRIGTLSIY